MFFIGILGGLLVSVFGSFFVALLLTIVLQAADKELEDLKGSYYFVGFGDALIVFYIAKAWSSNNAADSAIIALVISSIVGFIGVYYFTREWFPEYYKKRDK